MSKQLGFFIDNTACTGCKSCVIACKDKNDNPLGVNFRRVFQFGGGSWVQHQTQRNLMQPVNLYYYSVSLGCNHCESPACMAACPTAAISKDENGVVTVDQSKCVGCRYCEWACPYGTPQFDAATGVMSKCDFCQDLLAKGENPACVDACPMRAIEFGEIGMLRAKYGNVNMVEPLPTGDITHPSLVIKTHPKAQFDSKGGGRIFKQPQEA